jgi:hypothetical protein
MGKREVSKYAGPIFSTCLKDRPFGSYTYIVNAVDENKPQFSVMPDRGQQRDR